MGTLSWNRDLLEQSCTWLAKSNNAPNIPGGGAAIEDAVGAGAAVLLEEEVVRHVVVELAGVGLTFGARAFR